MDREIRTIGIEAEIRATRRGRTIEGYAIVFNKESRDLGGFKEVILPEAVDGVLENSDVLALLNHSEERGILARWTNGNGTLDLLKDSVGVKYTFEAPETTLGDEVLSGVRRGDIRTSSFAFSCTTPENQIWQKLPDGTYLRTIKKFDGIYDISPVYREAYADTSVAVRNLVEIKTKDQVSDKEAKIADLEEELRRLKIVIEIENETPSDSPDAEDGEDLTDYYEQLKAKIPKKC